MTFACFDQTILVARLVMLAALLGGEARAQSITVDGRLGPAQTLAGPNYAIGAGLGRQVGGNLFHSFGAFGLKGGETATFSGPAGVGHVTGRVTGGAASSINGAIRSTILGGRAFTWSTRPAWCSGRTLAWTWAAASTPAPPTTCACGTGRGSGPAARTPAR